MRYLLALLFFTSSSVMGAGLSCNKNNTNHSTLSNYTLPEINEAYNLQVNLLQAIQNNNIKVLNDIFLFELISSTKLGDLKKNNYELILNQSSKKAFTKIKPDCNSVGARGWMLGSGEVWIQSYPSEGVRILSVNLSDTQ